MRSISILKKIVLIFCFFNIRSEAVASFRVSNGDGVGTLRNPWFLGEEPVRYCVSDKRENISKPITQVVRKVINEWVNTFQNLDSTPLTATPIKNRNISTNFIEIGCSEKPELTIYNCGGYEELGYPIRGDLYSTYGDWAIRTEYDINTGRGRGAILVCGEDSEGDDNTFKNQVSHEFGHVFGFDHLPKGILSPKDSTQKKEQEPFALARLNWYKNDLDFCGQFSLDNYEKISKFLNAGQITQNDDLIACIKRDKTNRSLINLNFYSHSQQKIKTTPLHLLSKWNTPLLEASSGVYPKIFEGQVSLNLNWTHAFIKLGSPDLGGWFQGSDGQYSFTLHTDVNDFQISIIYQKKNELKSERIQLNLVSSKYHPELVP